MHSLMLYEITGPPNQHRYALAISLGGLARPHWSPDPDSPRPHAPSPLQLWPVAASRGRTRGSRRGGVGVTKRRGPSLPPPPPLIRCPQARLPRAHPRRHRKHFLGLTDSALDQSPSRNSTLLHET